jgi:hypothetical protein
MSHQFETYEEFSAYGSVVKLEEYYKEKMHEYAQFATDLIETQFKDTSFLLEFIDCIACEFTEGNRSAELIFEGLGLKEVHAWALQRRFNPFCESFDETEVD